MRAERAFDPYIDMAIAELKGINPWSLSVAYGNVQNLVKNALGMVKPSDEALRRVIKIDEEFRSVAVAIGSSPFGAGTGLGADEHLPKLSRAIEALRDELHACPPSDMARCLGLT